MQSIFPYHPCLFPLELMKSKGPDILTRFFVRFPDAILRFLAVRVKHLVPPSSRIKTISFSGR
jgi:hypothetical protein